MEFLFWIVGLIPFEIIWGFLSEAAKWSLVEKLAVFFIVWYFVRKTIKQHFDNIEIGLFKVTDAVTALKDTMEDIEQAHLQRIENLENGVNTLNTKVKDLERKENGNSNH